MTKIHRMTLADIDMVYAIDKSTYSPTDWSRDAYVAELAKDYTVYATIYEGGIITGYIGMWQCMDELHIVNLAVHRDHQKKGHARELLAYAKQYAQKYKYIRITLEVRANNIPAIRLYEQAGYIEDGRRPKYYQDTGEDAIIMSLYLNDKIA